MIYMKWSGNSKTASELIKRLEATTLDRGHPTPGDLIVNWGTRRLDLPVGLRVLNRAVPDKLEAIQKLTEAGLRTVRVVPKDLEWLLRDVRHVAGKDLETERMIVMRESINEEYRIHSFCGKSIRVARKVPARPDHHPWIRTHRTGWKFEYRKDAVPKGARNLAHQAVKALGMDFGAVDIARLDPDGKLMILEVNSAPGLEGNGFEIYRKAISEAHRV